MPRTNAFIIGHGSWTPDDGHAKVPAGCTLSFYTEFGKTLGGTDSDNLIAGRLGRAAHRTVEEFMMVPNMKYFPMDAVDVQDARNLRRGTDVLVHTANDDGRDLKGLFAATTAQQVKDMDFHWAACSAIMFKNPTYDEDAHVGNTVTGMNLTEFTDGYYDYDYINGAYVLIFRK